MNRTKSNSISRVARVGAFAFMSLTFIVGGQSFAGTKDGGGNVRRSSRADLEEFVKNWPSSSTYLTDSNLYGGPFQITSKPLKPELAVVNKAITGMDYFSINDKLQVYLRDLKFEIRKECFEGKESKDASTERERNAPICLSESRLARFSRATLRQAIVPLIFHEVAHHFSFGEVEAQAFQELVEVHLEYRTTYLSAVRARFQCAFASMTELSPLQKKEVLAGVNQLRNGDGQQPLKMWPSVPDETRKQIRNACAAQSVSVGENLRRIYETYDGNVWAPIYPRNLSGKEKEQLLDYERYSVRKFTYLTMEHALREPAITGYSDCPVCKKQNLDPFYIMMLANKAAIDHIGQEVGRVQDEIILQFE